MADIADIQQLFYYARDNDALGVEAMLRKGVDVNARDPKDPDNETALIAASGCGSHQAIATLLRYGADTNAQDRWGSTAIIRAIEADKMNALAVLLLMGADPWGPDNPKEGCAALIRAAELGRIKAISLLAEHGVDPAQDCSEDAVLVRAARSKQVGAIRLLLKMGVDVNSTDSEGNTALMAAAAYNAEDCVAELLNHQANPHLVNKAGDTAVHLTRNTRLLVLLLNRGANGEVPDKDGSTLLWKAAKGTGANFNFQVITALLDMGVDPRNDPHARAVYRRASKIVDDGGPEDGKLTPNEKRRALETAVRLKNELEPLIQAQNRQKDLMKIARQNGVRPKGPGRPAI